MMMFPCYFNFYNSDFEGPLNNTCVIFKETLFEAGTVVKYPMKNVISGRGHDPWIIEPLWQDPEPEDEPCAEYMDSYIADYNEDDYYLTIEEKVEIDCK